MSTHPRRLGAALSLFSLAIGCGAPEPAEPAVAAHAAALNLPHMQHTAPGRGACAAPTHRQFDFWVGKWNVRDIDGNQIGTNIVKQDMDGCAVEENWTDGGGGRGRSLNAYDRQTGKWHQTWVADALGHLRMAGGLNPMGQMVLTGSRVSAATGVTLLDRYVWTRLDANNVRQEGALDIPERDLHFSFDGYYQRSPSVTPVPSPGTTNCQAGAPGAPSRDLDFAVGRFRVQTEHGLPLGESEITTDLSGCLFEERARSLLGYKTRSFLYYDPVERRFYQTLIDNRGGRFELSGALVAGSLTLTGAAPDPVRVTLSARSADVLQQRWEISLDGGASWLTVLSLRYRRI